MEPCELSPSGVFDLYSCRSSKLLQKCNVVLNYAETFYKSNVNCTFFLYKNKFQKRRVWTCGVLKGGGGCMCCWGGGVGDFHRSVSGAGDVTWRGREGGVVFWTDSEVEGHFTHDALCVKANIWLTHVATKPNPTVEGVSSEPGPSCFPPRPQWCQNGVNTSQWRTHARPQGAHSCVKEKEKNTRFIFFHLSRRTGTFYFLACNVK